MSSSDNKPAISETTLNKEIPDNQPEKNVKNEAKIPISKSETSNKPVDNLKNTITILQKQKTDLETEIKQLQDSKNKLLSEQVNELQSTLTRLVTESVSDLEQRKQSLQITIEQLERRRDRIQEEMITTFAGVSQDLAIRVQGFKDYLVGSLQDLAAAAEHLELPSMDDWQPQETVTSPVTPSEPSLTPQFTQQRFDVQQNQIKAILDQYRTLPDYYGPPWQLRRTFEPIHAKRVQDWFFTQGGRGVIKTMGSRLQNILVASACVSVLSKLYGDRSKTLILANTPERLGEWRRGLQDCLGISRSDFGPRSGVILFDTTEAVIARAERLVEQKELPLIIVDETEDQISLGLLQFPLWLAFTPDPDRYKDYDF